jgi:hypothetical protein
LEQQLCRAATSFVHQKQLQAVASSKRERSELLTSTSSEKNVDSAIHTQPPHSFFKRYCKQQHHQNVKGLICLTMSSSKELSRQLHQ